MISDLTDSDGGDRMEYWKQILTNREITYNKVMTTKREDGTESHQTFSVRTEHMSVHIFCTNRCAHRALHMRRQ